MRRLAPLLVLVAAAGCGGGERTVETRQVAPYDRIEVSENMDVQVVPGDGREVRVAAGEHVIDRVVTESSGGVLTIDIRDRGIVIGPDPLDDVSVQVPVSDLAAVDVDGSGDVVLEGLNVESLELDLRGAADLRASGTAERLRARVRGAGDADLAQLDARTATVVAEGAADVELSVRDRLDVLVGGAGDVSYRGDPVVHSDVRGAGDLRRIRP